MLVTVTLTPGRTAPLESVTVPLMLPYTACAAAGKGARAHNATRMGSASLRRERNHNRLPANMVSLLESRGRRFVAAARRSLGIRT